MPKTLLTTAPRRVVSHITVNATSTPEDTVARPAAENSTGSQGVLIGSVANDSLAHNTQALRTGEKLKPAGLERLCLRPTLGRCAEQSPFLAINTASS